VFDIIIILYFRSIWIVY